MAAIAPGEQVYKISDAQERALLLYSQGAQQSLLNQFSIRSNLEAIDRAYMRENDFTPEQLRNRLANKAGDAKKIQNAVFPIIMPQVEAALAYFTNVFLTGYPIFGVSSDPSMEDAALQLETIIGENAITAGWARQLMMFFRDGLKYNLHGIECDWQQKTVSSIETDIAYPNSAKPKSVLWKGNVLRRMDMYNTFFDPRVHPAEMHIKGEFAGYIEVMSRIQLKQLINELFGVVDPATAIRAFESSPGATAASASGNPYGYYMPIINPYPTMDRGNLQTFDWMNWALAADASKNRNIRYTNVYQVTTMYGRILPADFGFKVPGENTPQVWKMIIVNGQVVLYCKRQENAHNYIPIFFGQLMEDGLDYQTKSFAQNVSDYQDVASAMINGYLASARRKVGDRVLYDPLRVTEKDINSTDPAAKIPVRPTAYGKPVQESVYAFPFRDEQMQSMLQGADLIGKMADKVNQSNPAQQGQFVKGNKTRQEYDDVMGHGNGRNQCMAIMSEAQVFTPMKEVIKLNILQFQPETVLFNRDKSQQVAIKPEELRATSVHFKVSDGLLPESKLMSSDDMTMAMQTLGSSPALSQGYNMAPLFTYLFKLKGADLKPFEKSPLQMQFEQMTTQWQQTCIQMIKSNPQLDPRALPPQPQMPPELIKELQQKQASGGVLPAQSQTADVSTTGAQS